MSDQFHATVIIPPWKSPRYPLSKRLGGRQRRWTLWRRDNVSPTGSEIRGTLTRSIRGGGGGGGGAGGGGGIVVVVVVVVIIVACL
jgi:hypothetical protein